MEPDVSAEDITHLEALANTLRRRLRVIETQCAGYGPLAVPPHLVVEKEDAEQQLTRILARLDQLRARPTDSHNPYLGLLTFQEEDADRFFGRDTLVADLVARAAGTSFLAVLGPSGSGKSSVVRAGLLPMLKGNALPSSEHWRYAVLRPGARPLDALAAELAKLLGSDLDQALRLRTNLADHNNALLMAADLLLDRKTEQRLVLVVDQFEELWTLTQSEERAQFINVLLTAANAPDAPLLLVLAMRADFLHRAAEHPNLAQAIADHDVIISPMTDVELHAAIVRPAEAAGGSFESGLVDELVHQALGRAGALPLLEYTLQELWKQRESDILTWAVYRTLGGIEGALAARADAILSQGYTTAQQDDLRRLLLRLVQPGEGAADTRRRVFLDDLVPAGTSLDAVQALLKLLADERLITTSHDPINDEETIELSHEAIIRAWPTFGRWIDEARADLRFQLQLEEAAREWRANGENPDLLWGGLRLAQAEPWIERAQPRLNMRDQAFLNASRTQVAARVAAENATQREREALLEARAVAERRSASRLRIFLAMGGILLLLSLGLAIYALGQRETAQQAAIQAQQQARIANAQATAGESLFELGRGNADRALLLARTAVLTNTKIFPALVVRALRQTVQATIPSVVLHYHDFHFGEVAWSPDGKQVITQNSVKDLQVWEAASGQQLSTLEGHTGNVRAVARSPDGTQLLSGSDDKTARVWDAASGRPASILEGHTGSVRAVAWSPDGKQIVTGSDDKTARVWDAASGRPVSILQGHTGSVRAVAWSPDGKQIVTGSDDKTARVWDIVSSRLVATLEGHRSTVIVVAWSPDGKKVFTGSYDDTAREWDIASGQLVSTLEGHTGSVKEVAWSPDGKQVVTGSDDKTARVWDAASGRLVSTLQGHTGSVKEVAWSPDGKQIVTGSDDKTARVWDAASGRPVSILQGHTGSVGAVAWSPDGKQVISGSHDDTARLWDAASGRLVSILQGHTGSVGAVAWSPDGKQIVTGSDNNVRVWDAASEQLVSTLERDISSVMVLALSPDRKQVVIGSSAPIGRLSDAAFGRLVTTLRVWDVTNGRLVTTLEDHTDWVNMVAWSPDGRQLLTGSRDNIAQVWDTASGQLVSTLESHIGSVYAVAWSPDGKQLLTGSDDKTALIWIADNHPIIAELTRRVCNIFTDDDIRQTIPTWRGCTAELADVADDLKEYDALRPRR